jgi:hypothetical protein
MATLIKTSPFLFAKRSSMLNCLKVLFEQPEYSALIRLSESEMRTPADQVRLIVRLELVRRGLLQDTLPNLIHPQEDSHKHESTC